MAKSRNRSRDARKRAAKKRKNRLYQERKKVDEREFVECPKCGESTPKTAVENNGCCLNCWLGERPKPKPKFAETHCSQCGANFGPRDSGFSHCEDHYGIAKIEDY
jgi:hypothetical protein